jgi:hypothetical protein
VGHVRFSGVLDGREYTRFPALQHLLAKTAKQREAREEKPKTELNEPPDLQDRGVHCLVLVVVVLRVLREERLQG